jgi:hypothetical protein
LYSSKTPNQPVGRVFLVFLLSPPVPTMLQKNEERRNSNAKENKSNDKETAVLCM